VASYRERIYASYARKIKDSGAEFDFDKGRRWGSARRHDLRGWLPANREATIVDLTCGNGSLLQFFKEGGYNDLTGVDISLDQVQLAQPVISNVIHGNVLDHLEEHAERYDLLTAYDLLEHLHKDEVLRFLELSFNALKQGGRIVLQTPNAASPMVCALRYGDFTHEVCFTPDVLKRLFNLSGFDGIQLREVGPVPWGYSLMSTSRYIIWRMVGSMIALYNLAETGSAGSGISTRVFPASAVKTSTTNTCLTP
jgi:SAM-dependent methyltransferase